MAGHMACCTAPAPPKKVMKTARLAADPPSGPPAAHSDWRDWANLTEGPAGQIAERLLADDVADYLRFRAACGTWRRSTACPHARDGLDRRFHPRRWLMLPPALSGGVRKRRRRELLSATTGARIHVHLPELRHQYVLGPTSGGLLVICDQRTNAIRLLNPLTRHLTAGLPDAASLLYTPAEATQQEPSMYRLQSLQLHRAGLANDDDSTVALHFHANWLVVAKPGDLRWRRLMGAGFVLAALSFAGRFFCVTQKAIAVVDTAAEYPQLAPVAQLPPGWELRLFDNSVKLVDNNGELILVRLRTPPDNDNIHRRGYEVRVLDLDAGITAPVAGLGGRALFVGEGPRGCNPALSVPAGLCPCIRADTVYTCRDFCGSGRLPEVAARPVKYMRPGFLQDVGRCSVLHSMSRYVCSSEIIMSPPRRGQREASQRRRLLSCQFTTTF